MKALLLKDYMHLEMTDAPDPEIGLDEVLVRVQACGICGSDIHGYDGHTGRRIPPLIMGHEASGIVAEVGAGARERRAGGAGVHAQRGGGGGGTLGVTFFDLRDARLTDASTLRVTPWLATSRDGGATWHEEALSDPFDLRPALLRDDYFLGDYQGLGVAGTMFLPFFAIATQIDGDRTDVVFHPMR